MKTVNQQWRVTKKGDIRENARNGYGIDHKDLHRSREGYPCWIFHMSEKGWVNLDSFAQAFIYAQNVMGKQYFTREQILKAVIKAKRENRI
jgi:hypothetical protein